MKALVNSEAMKKQFAQALPKVLPADRFARISTTALARNPALAKCTPSSFMGCLLELAALGLEPDGRRAHLIPRGQECTVIIDYKGLVELVMRSGDVSNIHCDVVCEEDEFEENLGQVTVHRIDRRSSRGKPFAAYSRVTMKDGTISCMVMGLEEIEAVRRSSKSGAAGPWKDHWGEMAKKTVFRRHAKWLPLSAEARDAVEKADDFEEKAVAGTVVSDSTAPKPLLPLATQPRPDPTPGPEPEEAEVVVEEPEPAPVKAAGKAKPAQAAPAEPVADMGPDESTPFD